MQKQVTASNPKNEGWAQSLKRSKRRFSKLKAKWIRRNNKNKRWDQKEKLEELWWMFNKVDSDRTHWNNWRIGSNSSRQRQHVADSASHGCTWRKSYQKAIKNPATLPTLKKKDFTAAERGLQETQRALSHDRQTDRQTPIESMEREWNEKEEEENDWEDGNGERGWTTWCDGSLEEQKRGWEVARKRKRSHAGVRRKGNDAKGREDLHDSAHYGVRYGCDGERVRTFFFVFFLKKRQGKKESVQWKQLQRLELRLRGIKIPSFLLFTQVSS